VRHEASGQQFACSNLNGVANSKPVYIMSKVIHAKSRTISENRGCQLEWTAESRVFSDARQLPKLLGLVLLQGQESLVKLAKHPGHAALLRPTRLTWTVTWNDVALFKDAKLPSVLM
jgi:hypothetical protein